jgi:hypothetical protein
VVFSKASYDSICVKVCVEKGLRTASISKFVDMDMMLSSSGNFAYMTCSHGNICNVNTLIFIDSVQDPDRYEYFVEWAVSD